MSELIDELTADLATAMQSFVDEIADETRERVSVPVQVITGPRGGRRVIRSRPGEPPRKDTGALQDSVSVNVAETTENVDGYVHVGVHYSEPLQTKMRRLILDDRADEFADRFTDQMADAV